MEVFAQPRPGARDAQNRPIDFALVDIDVAPDGSIFLTDHNQGIWRIIYDPEKKSTSAPPVIPALPPLPADRASLLEQLVSLPQPASEWTRLREVEIQKAAGGGLWSDVMLLAKDSRAPLRRRLRALRLIAPGFDRLPELYVRDLAADATAEMRGQAAWLIGIRGRESEAGILRRLLTDDDGFVRRRAAEGFTRLHSAGAIPELVQRLNDPSRLVRFVAMAALAHFPAQSWVEEALRRPQPQVRMRALVSRIMRKEPMDSAQLHPAIESLLAQVNPSSEREERLDLLRILGLFQKQVEESPSLLANVQRHLLDSFPDADTDIRWEQVRLLGSYRFTNGFHPLLDLLENEPHPVTQFHIGQAIARLPAGWTPATEKRLVEWFLGTQQGWFAEFDGKGRQFPEFWGTVLNEFGSNHRELLLAELPRINLGSLLGNVALEFVSAAPDAHEQLLAFYRGTSSIEARLKILRSFTPATVAETSGFLREEYTRTQDARLRGALIRALARMPAEQNLPLIVEGLRYEDADVVRACALALAQSKPVLSRELAGSLIDQLSTGSPAFHAVEYTLIALSGQERPGAARDRNQDRRPSEPMRQAAVEFWKDWHLARFNQPLESRALVRTRSNEALHRFLLSNRAGNGNPIRGAQVYERLQCHACHGGGSSPGDAGRLFGPELAGVTRALQPAELADALVYPSKQVADRFKAVELETKDGLSFSGFITEQDDQTVTLADREQVRRIPRAEIELIAPQNESLMPEGLLTGLSDAEIRDLLAYLDQLGTARAE
jgi:putative heme-binding domain-containing protein